MSTSESSSIDEKKTGNSSSETPNFKAFLQNYIYSVIFTIGFSVFFIGSLGLFTTKVAQANILPDDIKLAPYTVYDRVVNDIPISINIMRKYFWSDNKETLSQKVIFNSQDYLDSFKNSIFLCKLKENASPNSSILSNGPLYFSKVYDSIIATNFWAISSIFLYLSYLPESVIMLLYSFFGIFLWTGLYFFNICISIFFHFINIPELFRTSSYHNENIWESEEGISFLRPMKFILFFFFWWLISFISAFVIPIFSTIYGLISPLYATYRLQNTKEDRNIFDFIKDTFAYKKVFFLILATFSLLSNGIQYLGSGSIIGIILAILIAYFVLGLYSNNLPEPNTDGFTLKINQKVVQATVEDINETAPKLIELCKPILDEKNDDLIKNYKNNFSDRIARKKAQKGAYSEPTNVQPPEITVQPPEINVQPPELTVQSPEINVQPPELTVQTTEETYNKPKIGGKKINKHVTSSKKYNIRFV
jgi:hypothetical protein